MPSRGPSVSCSNVLLKMDNDETGSASALAVCQRSRRHHVAEVLKKNNMSAIASAMDPDEYHASCLVMAALTQLLIQFRFMMMSYVRRQVEWQTMFEMAEVQYNDNVQSLIESHARGIQLIRGSWLLQHEDNFGRRNHPYRRYVSHIKRLMRDGSTTVILYL